MTPDGLSLGPLNLGWASLTLLLGLLTWNALARFSHAGLAALVALLVARVWAALAGLMAAGWNTGLTPPQYVWEVLDVRRGDWAWGAGLAAGALTLWLASGRRWPAGATSALALTLLVGTLPLLLQPAPAQMQFPAAALPALTATARYPATIPSTGGSVVNFWATWCGPCRAELPLLAQAQARGERVVLVNVGESAEQVQGFLQQEGLELQTYLGGETLAGELQVRAFPTTFAVQSSGHIAARHMGPLSVGQLARLLEAALLPQ